MEKELHQQLCNNNELLIQTIIKQTQNNETTLELLQDQKQVNNSLIEHLKEHYDKLDQIPIKTKAEESKYQLLKKILLDFWGYR